MDKRSAAHAIAVLQQGADIRHGQLQRSNGLHSLGFGMEGVDQHIGRKCEDHFRVRQLPEDATYEGQLDLGEPGLVKKNDGPPGTRLSTTDIRHDAVDLVSEAASLDYDALASMIVTTLGQDLGQMVGVSLFTSTK